jgi:hypothetical protein
LCFAAVVRQALMQNQAPEIQAKLLAMQRQIQQQQTQSSQLATTQVIQSKSLLATPTKTHVSPAAGGSGSSNADSSRTKKPLSQEQKEEQMR